MIYSITSYVASYPGFLHTGTRLLVMYMFSVGFIQTGSHALLLQTTELVLLYGVLFTCDCIARCADQKHTVHGVLFAQLLISKHGYKKLCKCMAVTFQ